MVYVLTPTVRPSPTFDVKEDAVAMRDAIKAANTDEAAIIKILTDISHDQRMELEFTYNVNYNRKLFKDLKKTLTGRFEHVIKALMMPPVDYLCKRMHSALTNPGLNKAENVVIEVLFSRSNEEIAQIVKRYKELYKCSLAEHINTETFTADFRLLLIALLELKREPSDAIDTVRAKQQAQQLFDVGKGKLYPGLEIFYRMLCQLSFPQLRLVFEFYKEISSHSIHHAIKKGMSKYQDIMLSIVECVQSPPAFFATRLFKAMDGAGTDDTTLIRIIVSRSEIDLGNIKEEFERLYNRTLVSAVKSETSGDYKRALCALIGGA